VCPAGVLVCAPVVVDVCHLVDLVQGRDVVPAQHPPGPVDVEGLVPAGDEQGGDCVAAEVDQGAAFGHELVDAEHEHDAGRRDGADGGQCGGQRDEATTGDTGSTFRGEQHDADQSELLGNGQVGVGGLGDVE